MSNTAINNLPNLDPTSITNISSLSFYCVDSGASKLITGDILQALVGKSAYTQGVLSLDYSTADSRVFWDYVSYDPYSLWSTNSKSIFEMTFNGWVQIQAHFAVETSAGGRNGFRATLNGSAHWFMPRIASGWAGRVRQQLYSMPFTVAIGDQIEFLRDTEHGSNVYTLTASMGCWCIIQPLALL